jgi:hypothetical protein
MIIKIKRTIKKKKEKLMNDYERSLCTKTKKKSTINIIMDDIKIIKIKKQKINKENEDYYIFHYFPKKNSRNF